MNALRSILRRLLTWMGEPPAEPTPVRPWAGDAAALRAALRKGDPKALERAYRLAFASEEGRFVLAHIAAEGGVGRPFAGRGEHFDLAYHQGAHDYALAILERAGFDPASAAVMVMTGHLEGQHYDHGSSGDGRSPDGFDPDEFDPD